MSEQSSDESPPLIDRLREEPFRVFFPLGLIASVWGVMLWPAYYAKWITWWPTEAHTRLMVVGFVGCFIMGFLGTAGPRLLGAKPFRRLELGWHGVLAVVVMAVLALNRIALADLLTAVWWLGFLGSLLHRLLCEREDVPPPGFPVAMAAVLLGAASAAYLGGVGHGWLSPSDFLFNLSRLFLFQGVIWLPIIGVAPFILPRFFGKKTEHGFEESMTLPEGWGKQAAMSIAAGVLVGVSFVMEAHGMLAAGMWVRATIVLGYLPAAIPGLLERTGRGALVMAIRFSFLGGVVGWIVAACYPETRIGSLHLGFVGGGGLLILTVATRVILGHGERHDRLAGKMRWFHAVTVLAVLAATTRQSADFIPSIRVSHFIYGALSWVAVVIVWAVWLRRELRAPELESALWVKSNCPRRQKRLAQKAEEEAEEEDATP